MAPAVPYPQLMHRSITWVADKLLPGDADQHRMPVSSTLVELREQLEVMLLGLPKPKPGSKNDQRLDTGINAAGSVHAERLEPPVSRSHSVALAAWCAECPACASGRLRPCFSRQADRGGIAAQGGDVVDDPLGLNSPTGHGGYGRIDRRWEATRPDAPLSTGMIDSVPHARSLMASAPDRELRTDIDQIGALIFASASHG